MECVVEAMNVNAANPIPGLIHFYSPISTKPPGATPHWVPGMKGKGLTLKSAPKADIYYAPEGGILLFPSTSFTFPGNTLIQSRGSNRRT